MRYFKFIIIGALILFILLTAMGLLMPSTVAVGRSVEINAPVDSVRFYTNNISNWKYWIKGADTIYFKQLTSSSTTKNSQFNFGAYTVTIIDSKPDDLITEWQKKQGRKLINRLELNYDAQRNETVVNWSFQQKLNWYFWERLSAMLHDKVFGPSMEISLDKLKQLCEK